MATQLLDLDERYNVKVSALRGDMRRSSSEAQTYVFTKTCLEVYQNLSICSKSLSRSALRRPVPRPVGLALRTAQLS